MKTTTEKIYAYLLQKYEWNTELVEKHLSLRGFAPASSDAAFWGGFIAAGAELREVIANRAKNKTELAVCLAPKQFSCWNKIPVERGIEIAKRHPKWSYALALVNQKTNYTSGATHYHAQKVSPSWAKKLAKTVQIGHHIFYK